MSHLTDYATDEPDTGSSALPSCSPGAMSAPGQIDLDDEVATIVAPNTTRLSGVSDDAELARVEARGRSHPFRRVSPGANA